MELVKSLLGEHVLVITDAESGFDGDKQLKAKFDNITEIDENNWEYKVAVLHNTEINDITRTFEIAPYSTVEIFNDVDYKGGSLELKNNSLEWKKIDFAELNTLNNLAGNKMGNGGSAASSFRLNFRAKDFLDKLLECTSDGTGIYCNNPDTQKYVCQSGLNAATEYCGKTFEEKSNWLKDKKWMLIGAVIGFILILAVIITIIAKMKSSKSDGKNKDYIGVDKKLY